MACFLSKRRPYTLLLLLGCALASPALAQPSWEPTESFELWWRAPPTPWPLFDARQLYEIRWPELDRRLYEIHRSLPEPQGPLPEFRWPATSLSRQIHTMQWPLHDERWRPEETQLRSREREMLSYLDRRANPHQEYLSDQFKQDAVLLGLKAKDVALTVVAPTPLKISSLVLSTIGSFAPRGSTAEQRLQAGALGAKVIQLGIEEKFASGPVLFTIVDKVFSHWASDRASRIVQQEYVSENSLSSRWIQDDLTRRIVGSTTVTNWESFQPGTRPGRIGPIEFFDGKYERRTTVSSTYRTTTRGGLLFSQPDLDALERRRSTGLLSDFRIEPEDPRDFGSDDPPAPKDLGGVDINIELEERETQDTGLYESVLEARPEGNVPAWDFPLPTADPKGKKERNKKKEGNVP